MKLFFIKPAVFSPLIFFIVRVVSNEEVLKIESLAPELFQFLIEKEHATTKNILIISMIKDHEQKTVNYVLPSIESDAALLEKCHTRQNLLKTILIETLKNYQTELYINVDESELIVHYDKISLMEMVNFFN